MHFVAVLTVNLDAAYYYVKNICQMSCFQLVLSSVEIDGIVFKCDPCQAPTKSSYVSLSTVFEAVILWRVGYHNIC